MRKKIVMLFTVFILSSPALADVPTAFAGKGLPWPAASRPMLAAPEKFFPITPGAHVQPRARGFQPPAAPKPSSSSAAASSGEMTEEQARQLLSVYPVHR